MFDHAHLQPDEQDDDLEYGDDGFDDEDQDDDEDEDDEEEEEEGTWQVGRSPCPYA